MNYYELLNVKESASTSEIKKSYKALVKKYHPDVYKGDKAFAEKKIKELNQAYEILSDSAAKSEYDRVLNSVREETSKIFSTSNYTDTSSVQAEKEDLEKRYNEMYNYDYYKKYTTNYYGVDKSKERTKTTTTEINADTFVEKGRTIINRFVSTAQTKVLILVLALLLIIGLIVAISLLSKVNNLLSNPVYLDNLNSNTNNIDNYNYNITYPYDYNYGDYGGYGQNLNELYSEYSNYLSNYLYDEFDGVIKNGVSMYQVAAFYGEPEKYEEYNGYIYAYYQTSYVVYNQYGLVIDVINNGYFLTENELNNYQNQTIEP